MPRDKTAEAEKMPIALAWGKRGRGKETETGYKGSCRMFAQPSQFGPTLIRNPQVGFLRMPDTRCLKQGSCLT